MDFQFDTTADGRTLKMLNVTDDVSPPANASQSKSIVPSTL